MKESKEQREARQQEMLARVFRHYGNAVKNDDPARLAASVAQHLTLDELREDAKHARAVSRFFRDAARTLEAEARRRADDPGDG